MIISEKQIMKLINIAQHYLDTILLLEGPQGTDFSRLVKSLLSTIQLQQSDELKVIE